MLYQLEIKTHSNQILRYRPRSRRRKEICEPENSNKSNWLFQVRSNDLYIVTYRSGPTDIYEEVLQQKARCNVILGSKNQMIQVISLFCLFVFCFLCNDILGSKIQVTFLLIVFSSFLLFSSFDSLSFHLFVFFAMISLAPNIIHDLGENIIILSSFVTNIRKWKFGFATTQEQMTTRIKSERTILRS